MQKEENRSKICIYNYFVVLLPPLNPQGGLCSYSSSRVWIIGNSKFDRISVLRSTRMHRLYASIDKLPWKPQSSGPL